MSGLTKIEWADRVWNPVTGCTPISPGCANCYAKRMASRLAGRCGYPADDPFRVTVHEDKFNEPVHWRKPARIFVGSMTDIFHDEVPFEALACKKSAIPYKSNRHWLDGSWRSMTGWDIHNGKGGSYALDYRFILDGYYYEADHSWDAGRRRKGLLQDICTIARNLGFELVSDACILDGKWTPGEWHEATFKGGVLFAAKVYMNGNLHFKFHKEFMGRLNVEAGRLLGWVTSQRQAEEEMGDNAAKGAWGTSFALDMASVKALAAA